MWLLKTIIVLLIVRAVGMIKKGSDKHINKIPESPSLFRKLQKALYFVELIISSGDCYQCK